MRSFLLPAFAGFATAAAALLVLVLAARLVNDRRRRLDSALRPELEAAVVAYLASEADEPPPVPQSRRAVRILREIGLEALQEIRGAERIRLVRLLERSGVVMETADELRSRRRTVRRRAAAALAQIGSAEPVDSLLAHLDDRDLEVRVMCAQALAELGGRRFIHAAAEALAGFADRRPGQAAEVILAIASSDPEALGPLLASKRSPTMRRLLTAVIGERRLADYAAVVRSELYGDDPALVAAAARAAGRIGDVDAVERLVELMEDARRPVPVRTNAVTALGSIGDPRALPHLVRRLDDGEWEVGDAAARALAMLGDGGRSALTAAAADAGVAAPHAVAALDA